MGDVRYERHYEQVAQAPDRSAALRGMSADGVVMALAAASRRNDPLLANVLATEAMNRVRRAEAILEHLGEGVLALDAENRIRYANPAALEILGYDRDELLGEVLHDKVHVHEDGTPMEIDDCAVWVTLQTGRTTHRRDHGDGFRRKDGSIFPVELTSAPVLREDEVEGAVVVFGDVTQVKRAEEAQRHLAAIVDASQDAITVETPEGVITHWNPAAERMFGYSADEIIGKSITLLMPPERQDEVDLTERVGREGASFSYETERVRKDGSRLPVSVVLSPLRDETGAARGLSAIYRDISVQKAQQRELADLLARERETHATVKYRLTTLLPALAWGLGSVILIRTLLLVWFALSPQSWGEGLMLATTTLALAVGGLVGAGVYFWKRREGRRV